MPQDFIWDMESSQKGWQEPSCKFVPRSSYPAADLSEHTTASGASVEGERKRRQHVAGPGTEDPVCIRKPPTRLALDDTGQER
eukprot:CAMPEP_0194503966 /NCGR_PEP_ID=MMETSP0253-20130528/28680_1 /TAXON_ID=2966 /ORGANISM="Noctiluca scintillans" /LENGTH=82 /DNA_ID=CAMNT_0039346305 /DNA_START=11 /DNA_END=257 /DNA_ORIENTATION=-